MLIDWISRLVHRRADEQRTRVSRLRRRLAALWSVTPAEARTFVATTLLGAARRFRRRGKCGWPTALTSAEAAPALQIVARFVRGCHRVERRQAAAEITGIVGELLLSDELQKTDARPEAFDFAKAFSAVLAQRSRAEQLQIANSLAHRARIYSAGGKWQELRWPKGIAAQRLSVAAHAFMLDDRHSRRVANLRELTKIIARIVVPKGGDLRAGCVSDDANAMLGRLGYWLNDGLDDEAWDVGGEG